MLVNYFITTIRLFRSQPIYTIINILGLSLGIICVIFNFLWIYDELIYDKFHPEADRLYRVESLMDFEYPTLWPVTPDLLAESLKENLPEVEESARMKKGYQYTIQSDDEIFTENGFYYVSFSFFDILYFPYTSTNPKKALNQPFTLLISEEMNQKYFSDENPVGKTLRVNNKYLFNIVGVFKNYPSNSHLKIDFLAPFNTLQYTGEHLGRWGRFDFITFIRIKQGTNVEYFNEKISGYLKSYNKSTNSKLQLQLVKDIHLYSITGTGNIVYVYIISVIGILILLIAFINFVNISTARGIERTKEIAIRKILGANRKKLFKQIYFELSFLTVIALILAYLIALILLPSFNHLSGKQLTHNMLFQPGVLLGIGCIIVSAIIFSGIYPAISLSAFHPVSIFSQRDHVVKGRLLRKILMIFQFTVSAVLIFCTIVIQKQLHYIQNKNLGFIKNQIVYVKLNSEASKKLDVILNKFNQINGVDSLAISNRILVNMGTFRQINRWEGHTSDDQIMINEMGIDHRFIPLYNIRLEEGRNFRQDDDENKLIINREAVRKMGFEYPLGKLIYKGDEVYEIIGVTSNFHFKSLKSEITPLLLNYTDYGAYVSIKLRSNNMFATLKSIEKVVMELAPDCPFNYGFLDETIDSLYRIEMRVGKLVNIFTLLVIITSCMGLLSLSAFMAQSKTKEIGIRKAMGASSSQIFMLMSKEIFTLVFIANIIAGICGYLIIQRWLEDFVYRIEPDWFVFVEVVMLSLLLSLFTISYHSIKSLIVNPVNTLRHE
ncbi:hypothetical protein ES705_12905 [subsurface metagenome]